MTHERPQLASKTFPTQRFPCQQLARNVSSDEIAANANGRRSGVTEALLVLADGETFEGVAVGYQPSDGVATGEVVFNTALAGYQEILTDPSYAGQIVTFTYPHIGNYGVNERDDEARVPRCRGVIVRDLARRPSNWRATDDIDGFLAPPRGRRASPASTRVASPATSVAPARSPARSAPRIATRCSRPRRPTAAPTAGISRRDVTTPEPYTVGPDDATLYVVAYDFGIKRSILDQLVGAGCQVEVVPAGTSGADVLERAPDGVFLSNGPGDPAAVTAARESVQELLGNVPVFGICLGHQIMSLALGAETFKLRFGHHGGNHPVRHLDDRAGRDHESEPQLRGRRHVAARRERGVAPEPERRRRRRRAQRAPPRVQRAVPPRGRTRSARRALPVRGVHATHEGELVDAA